MVERLTYVVKEVIDETRDVKTIRIAPERGAIFDFKPGQFVNLAVSVKEGAPLVARPYSMSSTPTNKQHLSLTYKIVDREGSFSQLLKKLRPGDRVFITGPFGVFTLDPSKHKDVIMIAGGVGITPFHSMVSYCTEKGLANKLTLLYSNKTHEDVIFYKELMELEKRNPNFRCVCTVSREDGSEGWTGMRGRFDAEAIKSHAGGSLEGKYFMICGSNAFVKAFKDLLLGMGIAKDHVLYELFGEGV